MEDEQQHKQIVEINGIKMQIDMREATIIEHYKVGDPVRLLYKKWSDNYESHPAVIVGFDGFANKPTIRVLYVDKDGNIDTVDIFEGVDHEIAPRDRIDHLVNRANVLQAMDRKVLAKERELAVLKDHRSLFIEQFDQYFTDLDKEDVG